MAKLLVTLEIEFSDLPDEVRDELADGINFRSPDDREVADDLDTVPTVAEMTSDNIEDAVREFFDGISDYDMQAENWAGSEVYGYISECKVTSIKIASPSTENMEG